MTKIQRVSRAFKYIFLILLTLIPTTNMVFWLLCVPPGFPFPEELLIEIFRLFNTPLAAMPHGSLTPTMKIAGFCGSFITSAMTMYALYSMIRLFNLYEKGFIFTKANVLWIRRAGWALLFSEFLSPIQQAVSTYVLTSANAVGERFIAISFGQIDITIMIVAFVVLLVSWIMEEGRHLDIEKKRLEEEQSLII
ncbi:MAG: DUF2975 domain-containing protein [Desulfovibrio sp.]